MPSKFRFLETASRWREAVRISGLVVLAACGCGWRITKSGPENGAGGPSKNNSLFFLCCATVNSLIRSLLIPCSDMRRKQVQWVEIGSGCGFPRSRAQFEAPENAKFPAFFPVSRENAGRAGFACDCVHRQLSSRYPSVARFG